MAADDTLPQVIGNQGAQNAAAPRVVIDTNVWLDLFVFQDPIAEPLARELRLRTMLAVRSEQTDAELLAVLARARIAALLPTSASALLQHWQALAQGVLVLRSAPWLCRDPDDQKFLDLAYCVRARTLVTKDRALLRLAKMTRRDGLQIIGPAALRTEPSAPIGKNQVPPDVSPVFLDPSSTP